MRTPEKRRDKPRTSAKAESLYFPSTETRSLDGKTGTTSMAAHARRLQSEPSSTKRPISSHTTVTEDLESEGPWELLRTNVNCTIWKHFRAIMTFLQEKTDAIEKLSLKSTTAREENHSKGKKLKTWQFSRPKWRNTLGKGRRP